MTKRVVFVGIIGLLVSSFFVTHIAHADHGATLSLTPSSGTFVVGSTFDVSLVLDTNGVDTNAIAAFLKFPPDKLQVISSSAGKSAIDLWSVPPRFNNQSGTIELQGIIASGLNATDALITTITFRVRSTGSTIVEVADNSRVLQHDGNGTDFLQHQEHGIYLLRLPPPAGPIVVSETHPDQERWYKDSNISFVWSLPGGDTAQSGSYTLNAIPVDIPDNISEGSDQSVVYQQVSEGTKYFHIKALRSGVWGGTTHFALNIDTTQPAEFPIEVTPGARTNEKQPTVRFLTTDTLSGIDHYELKVVSLSAHKGILSPDQPLFIEVSSPFVLPKLEKGKYDVLVRAYDKAGNFREATQRITIRDIFFGLASNEGLEVDGWFVVPWTWFLVILVLLFSALGYEVLRLHQHERTLGESGKHLPPAVRTKLNELKKYRDKYGKIGMILLVAASFVFGGNDVSRARELKAEPPLISTVSRDISNQDIFYVGGKTNVPQSDVVFYLQNLTTGETGSFHVSSNEYGDWFYTHDTFLSSGDYLLWAQSKVGEATSAPSPQAALSVRPTAVQFGSSRLAYDILYQIALILLLIAVVTLAMMVRHGRRRVRSRQERLMKEVREAQEAVQRGFAVLRRDLQVELEIIQKTKLEKTLRKEEEERERQLLTDLADIERRIGKEIADIEYV